LAAHKGMPPVLRDMAPGLPKQGLPWGIEGEPGGSKIFALKRPFEADNEGDDTGHHRSLPSHIRTPSVPAPQTPKHNVPCGCTRHPKPPWKLLDVVALRPIKRARDWRTRR